MSMQPSTQDIGQWLREITAFAVSVGASDEKRTSLTAFGTYSVTLEAEDGRLNVTCGRELPAEVQNVLDMSRLAQAASNGARSAAMPTLAETSQAVGKQWVTFRAPLHLEGLTRNELAAAIWEVCKAQEFLAVQLNAYKELEAMSARMTALEVEAEAPPAEPAPPPPTPTPPPAAAAPAAVFCPNCGRQAKPQQRFCTGCGAPLEG